MPDQKPWDAKKEADQRLPSAGAEYQPAKKKDEPTEEELGEARRISHQEHSSRVREGQPCVLCRCRNGVHIGASVETTLQASILTLRSLTFSMRVVEPGVQLDIAFVARDTGKKRSQSMLIPWSNIDYVVLSKDDEG